MPGFKWVLVFYIIFFALVPVDLAEVDCVGLHQLLENHANIAQYQIMVKCWFACFWGTRHIIDLNLFYDEPHQILDSAVLALLSSSDANTVRLQGLQ